MGLVTKERLQAILQYQPEDGLFVRRVTRGPFVAGTVAGTVDRDGYRTIHLDGKFYAASRLAWFYMTGQWPAGEIDHIDGNPSNNAWANLRDVSRSVNAQNIHGAIKSQKHSSLLGAQWCSIRKRWKAVIRVDGGRQFLGYFQSDAEASSAYIAAKRKLHAGCTL